MSTDYSTILLPTLRPRRFLCLLIAFALLAGLSVAAQFRNLRTAEAALLDQAERALAKGESSRAIHYQRLFLETDSSNPTILIRQAYLLSGSSDPMAHAEALLLFEKLLLLQPTDNPTREKLVDLCLDARHYRDAQKHLEILIRSNGPTAKRLCGLAKCRWAMLDLPTAQRHFESAVELDPESLQAPAGLFDVAFQLRDREAMESALCRLGGLAPDDEQTLLRVKRFEQLPSR